MKHQGVERDDLLYNQVDTELDCPIWKLERRMLKNGLINEDEIQELVKSIESQIDEAIEFSLQSEFPQESDLLKEV